jgi:hypothetical protein
MLIKVALVTKPRLRAVLLAILSLLAGSVHGQVANEAVTLRVLVLDGNNGKPVRGRGVKITSSTTDELVTGRTDNDGVFSVTRKFPKNINVGVIGRPRCDVKKPATSIIFITSLVKVEDIVTRGVVESNSCNPNVKRSAVPGTLTLFVRHETVAEILDLR